jgi:hypothetical protein
MLRSRSAAKQWTSLDSYGELPSRTTALTSLNASTETYEEHAMNFDPIKEACYGALLEQAAARTGFSPIEMQELLECELHIDHLLDYISAVVSDRMN